MSEILPKSSVDDIFPTMSVDEIPGDYYPDGNDLDLEKLESIEEFQKIKSIEEFQKLLFDREVQEQDYGMYEKDQTVFKASLFNGGSESILSDIYQRNKDEGMGNIKIPETDIELVNYTACPECKSTYSFEETQAYYRNPVVPKGKNRMEHIRKDTRFLCPECKTYFLPALIMVNSAKPQNEFQYLCRLQTIDAIENFYMEHYKKQVLTQAKNNRKTLDKQFCILNDIRMSEMKAVPTLVSNLIQYTPYNLILNFIEGEHYRKDPLFGKWMNRN